MDSNNNKWFDFISFFSKLMKDKSFILNYKLLVLEDDSGVCFVDLSTSNRSLFIDFICDLQLNDSLVNHSYNINFDSSYLEVRLYVN